MKARLPVECKLTRKQQEAVKQISEEQAEAVYQRCQFIFFFSAFIALNEEFHFGNGRLKKFYDAVCETLKEAEAVVDHGAGDVVVDLLIRNLTSRNIAFEDIMDVEVTQVPEEYLTKTKYDRRGYLKAGDE